MSNAHDRLLQKIETFICLSERLAKLSTCKRAQVGAIVVPRDFSKILSIGYNGPAAKIENDSCENEEGACGCIHAEANSIIKLHKNDERCCRMLCTTSPCVTCAGLIINSGAISHVLYRNTYRDERGINILRKCGIQVGSIGDIHSVAIQEWW